MALTIAGRPVVGHFSARRLVYLQLVNAESVEYSSSEEPVFLKPIID